MVDLTLPGIAICIGCWEEQSQPIHQTIFNNIKCFIERSPSIEAVILSGNHTQIDQTSEGTNHWYSNSRNIFYEEQGVDWIRRYWLANQERTNYFATPAKTILNHPWKKICLTISEQWELQQLLNHEFFHIKNIWYFGIGWNVGIRRDYIGWGQLCDLIRFNQVRKDITILTKQDCSLVKLESETNFKLSKFNYPEFTESDWHQVESDIFYKSTLKWIHNNTDFI